MLWNEDKTRLDAFDAAVTVIRHIPMKHMRHGMPKLHYQHEILMHISID